MKLHPSIIIDTRWGVPPTKSKLYRKIAWIVRDAEYRCMKAVEEELDSLDATRLRFLAARDAGWLLELKYIKLLLEQP